MLSDVNISGQAFNYRNDTMSSLPYYHGTCITSTHYMVFNSARKTKKVLKMKYDGEQNL